MKHTRKSSFLLALVVLAPVALAQSRNSLKEDNISAEDSISAARSQYTQTSSSLPNADTTTLAQLPRRGAARPVPARRGYPRGSYQTQWMEHGNPGYALIGAGIGVGALFGFIGGAIGAAHGGPHMFTHRGRVYRLSSPVDDEQSQLGSHSKAKKGSLGRPVLVRQGSPDHQVAAEVVPPLNSGMLAVP